MVSLINGYEIKKEIGRGGNGIVNECYKNGKIYAIKAVKSSSKKKDSIERFERECNFMKNSNCSQIVKCYDFF